MQEHLSLVSKEAAANMLGISTRSLDRLRIPRFMVGGSVRFNPSDIETYIAAHRVAEGARA